MWKCASQHTYVLQETRETGGGPIVLRFTNEYTPDLMIEKSALVELFASR